LAHERQIARFDALDSGFVSFANALFGARAQFFPRDFFIEMQQRTLS
jgi:hypothetical protein